MQKIELSQVIKHPLSTEKSIRLMESENKLIFVVDRRAKKRDVKEAIEKMFKAKVDTVNTFISQRGEKRAYVKFSKETPAIDIATNLGLM
jgi:large subunit ribosomal protein L23